MDEAQVTRSSTAGQRWIPGVPGLVFGLVLASVLVGGWYRLFNDPGTFWHAQLGRDILTNGFVSSTDALTFTHRGDPWVDQSWLFDLGLAGVVERFGWSTAFVAVALLLATLYAAVAWDLMGQGRSPLVALAVAVMVAGVGSIHFLVRPHLFTLAFVWTTVWLCRRQHERGGWWVAWTIPLTALWANLHGGFLASPLIVFTAAVAHAASTPWDAETRRQTVRIALCGALCVAAAICNPYGFGLYQHVGRLLVTSGVTELIEEYQPVPFGKPDARIFEWILLALVALPTIVGAARMTRYELVHALVWLHLSLASVRHAPLFGLAVAPGLARVLDGLLDATRSGPAPARSESARGWSAWPAVAAVVLLALSVAGVRFGEFDRKHWPLAALPALDAAASDARLFHEQDWGGLVSSEPRPKRLAFIDDRFELYGKEGVLQYLNAMAGGPDWEVLRDRFGIGLVWLRPDRGLARRLRKDSAWRVLHEDAVSILLARDAATRPPDHKIVQHGPP